MEWTREAIAARVDSLRTDHDGAALIEAIARFSDQLDDDERAVLGDVLLERARAQRPSLAGVKREGWFQRQFRRREPR